MNVTPSSLPEVLIIDPKIYRDHRGAFMEIYNEQSMKDIGLPTSWLQDNLSVSKKNVVRGIHYQLNQPQGKLVRVLRGAVLDVAVDLRRSSQNFGKHVAIELNEDNARMLWIPIGFGHGFLALSEEATFTYKVTDYYSPLGERTILWNDPHLGIEWPVDQYSAIISTKDAQGKSLTEAEVFS